MKRAQPASRRVEKHVAFGEAVLMLVAVNRQMIERRARRAADVGNFDDVNSAVVAVRLFPVHRAEQHLRNRIPRQKPARFELFQMQPPTIADCGLRIAD